MRAVISSKLKQRRAFDVIRSKWADGVLTAQPTRGLLTEREGTPVVNYISVIKGESSTFRNSV